MRSNGEEMKINGIDINIEDISIDDMPNEDFKDIFDIFGAEVALNFLTYFAGTQINVPLHGFGKIKKKILLQHYDGTRQSIRRLSPKLGITERTAITYIQESGAVPPAEGQISLFGGNNG